jgi:acetyltransferase-like isoleucine patch superfamily enzyme
MPKRLYINMRGNNNTIKLFLPIRVSKNCISTLKADGTNNVIEIGNTDIFNNVSIVCAGCDTGVKIGKNVTFNGQKENRIYGLDGSKIIIGDDCMFSFGVQFQISDGHAIFDKDTGRVINKQRHPLIIGNHCWVGFNSVFLKHAVIPNNTIVGSQSVVAKTFVEEHTVIGGNPAAVVKTGVNWDKRCIADFELERGAVPQ